MNVPGCIALTLSKVSPDGSDGEESTQNVGDLGFITGLGRSPDEGMAAHNIILVWRSPWTEEPGELQSVGSQESDTSERLSPARRSLKSSSLHCRSVLAIDGFCHQMVSDWRSSG